MSYFSKEIYQKKRDYAYTVSSKGLENVATYLVAENPKYKNADLSNDDIFQEINSVIEDLINELEPIQQLSHKRHEIHSANRRHFVNDSSELSKIGNQYSDGCLIDDVNRLNRKYNLVKDVVKLIGDVGVSYDSDSDEEILGYYGEDYVGLDDNEIHEKAYELMVWDWDATINKWSDSVRAWFKEINKKFNTDFPA